MGLSTGARPNLLIVGAGKAGTSALHAYLAEHPEIFMSRRKELAYFHRPDWRERAGWYERQFAEGAALPVRGESSPHYSMDPFFPGVPGRVSEFVPDARIIFLLREPVARTIAHWRESYWQWHERRGLNEALADPHGPYVTSSLFAHQIERWLEVFPGERVLVLEQRELLEERSRTLDRVFEFLGIQTGFSSPAFEREVNQAEMRERRLTRLGVRAWKAGILNHDRLGSELHWLLSRKFEVPPLQPAVRERMEALFAADQARLPDVRARTAQI